MNLKQNNEFFEPKTEEELNIIRQASKVVSNIISKAKKNIKVGISTKDIDEIIYNEIKNYNCKPAFLNYRGYPSTSCISIDTELVHGIPSKKKIFSYGQVVSIDVGLILDGFYADAATTVFINNKDRSIKINEQTKVSLDKIWDLLNTTYDAMMHAIKILKAGVRTGDLGFEIQNFVEKKGYSVIREYVGHTIGRSLHEKPDIPNFGTQEEGTRFYEKQVICIEPMVSMGDFKTKVLEDGWTVIMQDGSLCAHYEHMVLIGKEKAEILTDPDVIKPQEIYG